MSMMTLLAAAAVAVMGPAGEKVCEVTPPDLPEGVVVETTNVAQAVAWRLRFTGTGERKISHEAWTFDFGKDYKCWPVSHAQGQYLPKTLGTLASMKRAPGLERVLKGDRNQNYITAYPDTAESPLVVEGDGFVAALGDAGCLDYARIRFASGDRPGRIRTVQEGDAVVQAPYVTPWRYIHVAKDAVALANAQPAVMDALNAPSKLSDTSWVKPGKVMRVARLTTDDARAVVDFAKANNIPYIELDSGWYGNERSGDPLKPGLAPEKLARGEHLDLLAVLAYARQKDVGVILYVNREPLRKNRDAILDQLAAWGVKGIKFGFVQVGSQACRQWMTDAIEAAAARHLLVDIHDEYRLTGIEKTYPHIMTVEGIHGNEEMPPAAHNAALAFTRFLDGPGDYTPCWTVNRIQTTCAHQLAMPAVYTSGWQFLFWYQRPADIRDPVGALDFWREIPTVFDETRFLQGTIGETVVVARRAGTKWFVGALNAGETRTLTVPLDFAGTVPRKVRLFRDADPSDTKPCAPVAHETCVTDKLVVPCAANGGFAAIVE